MTIIHYNPPISQGAGVAGAISQAGSQVIHPQCTRDIQGSSGEVMSNIYINSDPLKYQFIFGFHLCLYPMWDIVLAPNYKIHSYYFPAHS
jgi:hypothetical protein